MEGTICPVPWKVERLLGQHLNECKEYCLQHSRPILIVQQLLQWGRYLWGLHMRSPASQQVKYVDERADSKQPQILSVANLLWYGISITLTHSVLFKPNISIDFSNIREESNSISTTFLMLKESLLILILKMRKD